MRMPLDFDTESRDGSSDKDERLTNVLIEQDDNAKYVAIRPGLSLNAATTGIGKGLVAFQNELISVYGDTCFAGVELVGSATAHTMPEALVWVNVVWNGTIFCAIAYDSNKTAVSSDGLTWSYGGDLPSSDNWVGLAWNGSLFCATALNTNKAATSPDGTTWTARTLPSTSAWGSMCALGSTFCVFSQDELKTLASTDGITWTAGTPPDPSGFYVAIAASNSLIVLMSTDNLYATSTDGITWTQEMLGAAFFTAALVYGGSKFCAASYSGGETLVSSDGLSWVAGTTTDHVWNAGAYGDGYFIFVENGGDNCTYSSDGETWYTSTLTQSGQWLGAAGNDNVLIAVNGDTSTVANDIAISSQPAPVDTVTGEYFDFAESI